MRVTADRSLASDHAIRWALRQHMPNLDWTFKRPPPDDGGAWRVFAAKREGIEYSVSVLSWWREGVEKVAEYAFFVDGVCVLALKGVDHLHWAMRCAMTIRKLSQQAQDRASKLEDALNQKRHGDGYDGR